MSDSWVGKTIDGRYVLRRRIGKGGMGVVYEAEHAALERRVAIKLIAAAEATDGYLERFRREAKLASRITHEHLVHIYDIGSDRDTGADYIAMEYVDGHDLGKELKAGPLGIPRAVAITKQLLKGLQAIHSGGIIHRDIKPGNVMLTTRNGERDFVKLMDFGIARALGDASLTMTGHVMGTPSFMAPEQVRGQEVDHRTDLYAVGVTLFAMVAGKLPFEGDTAMLAGAHVFQPPPSLATVRPDTPRAIVVAVERALAKAPSDRFADARDFAAALDAPPPHARDAVETVAARPPRRERRSRAPWIAAVLVSCAAIAGAIAYTQRPTAKRDEVIATSPPPAPPAPAPAPVIDAAIDVDATIDLVEPAVPNAPPPAKGSVAKPVAAASNRPVQFCQCQPTNAPDVYGLCASAGRPVCRCDANGRSLCPSPLVNQGACDRYKDGGCQKLLVECPDKRYAEFHVPGTQGAACSGYEVPLFEARGSPDPIRGTLNCDVCPGTRLDSFRGQPGDPCTGYYWRTGEQKTGKLAHCREPT
ncbi:MAG: serine/threonine protein kinase [Deltaproteobacteria bacterium]|nr:serine/threonine protein kinase [Deltaproteobacteria bacterium]